MATVAKSLADDWVEGVCSSENEGLGDIIELIISSRCLVHRKSPCLCFDSTNNNTISDATRSAGDRVAETLGKTPGKLAKLCEAFYGGCSGDWKDLDVGCQRIIVSLADQA